MSWPGENTATPSPSTAYSRPRRQGESARAGRIGRRRGHLAGGQPESLQAPGGSGDEQRGPCGRERDPARRRHQGRERRVVGELGSGRGRAGRVGGGRRGRGGGGLGRGGAGLGARPAAASAPAHEDDRRHHAGRDHDGGQQRQQGPAATPPVAGRRGRRNRSDRRRRRRRPGPHRRDGERLALGRRQRDLLVRRLGLGLGLGLLVDRLGRVPRLLVRRLGLGLGLDRRRRRLEQLGLGLRLGLRGGTGPAGGERLVLRRERGRRQRVGRLDRRRAVAARRAEPGRAPPGGAGRAR